MNARIPMCAGSQVHVAELIGRICGASGFPGVAPVALTPEVQWRLAKRAGYTAMEVPRPLGGKGNAARAVLALITTGDGRCTTVLVTPCKVICRVRFPTVTASFFRGTVLDGYVTEGTFAVTDVIASRGRRVCGLNHPERLEQAWQLVQAVAAQDTRNTRHQNAPDPPLLVEVAQARTLEQLAALTLPQSVDRSTHLLIPMDRTFAPGRIQPDTFLVSLIGVNDMLKEAAEMKGWTQPATALAQV